MPRDLSVHFLPSLFSPEDLQGGIAVVIDVLRASTTITTALARGAKCVIPCTEVDEARKLSAEAGPATLLGGEREGDLIDGFDLDNSPLKYTRETVAGRTIVFTTTNGTRAMQRSRLAEEILIGAFINFGVVLERLRSDARPLHLVCAGTNGEITAEDCLFAGGLVIGLTTVDSAATAEQTFELNDQARMAAAFFATNVTDDDALLTAIKNSRGGRNLLKKGYTADIEFTATYDRFDIVPRYDPKLGEITIAAKEY